MRGYRGTSYSSGNSQRRFPQGRRSNYAVGDVGEPRQTQQSTGAGTLNQVKETAGDLASRSTQALSDLSSKAMNNASAATTRVGQMMRDNPLAAGAVASGITNVRQLPGSVDPNIAVGFSPDGHTIVGVSGEHKVLAWSLSTTEAQPMELLPDVVDIAALGPDGRWLVIDRSGMLQFFQWPSLTLVAEDEGRSIKDLALAGDGGTVAAGYRTSGVAVWNLEEHEWVRRACRIANRDLTTEEIQTHLGQTAPLLRCADLLAGPVANTR